MINPTLKWGISEKLVYNFLDKNHIFTSIINVTKNKYMIIQYDEKLIPSFPEELSFDDTIKNASSFVHPLFVKSYIENLSREKLVSASKRDESIKLEILHFFKADNKYHWVTVQVTPVTDGSEDVICIYTLIPTDNEVKSREMHRAEFFNRTVIDQLIYNYVLVYIIELNNGMSRLVHSRTGDEYDVYAERFTDHIGMMTDLLQQFISEEYKEGFSKFTDYNYIKQQLSCEKDRITYFFKDVSNRTFELMVTKYPEYSEDYPLVIFGIKELT